MNAQAIRAENHNTNISSLIITILLTGIASVVIWEIWARILVLYWIGGPLEPAGLIQAVFGLGDRNIAEAIHFGVGLIGYPLGYVLVARPIAKAIVPWMPWWLVALGYGVALWVFALYFMAHLAAGFPPFLGFTQLTWASLVGHMLFAFAGGVIVRARLG